MSVHLRSIHDGSEIPDEYWLCGDDECRGHLDRLPDMDAYRCQKCGKTWDSMRTHELNWGVDVVLAAQEGYRWPEGTTP